MEILYEGRKVNRELMIDIIVENVSFVPDDRLPLIAESALLLSDILPPWFDKCLNITPLEDLLSSSLRTGQWVEDDFYPADKLREID